ncbi:MAG: hypothetical protein MJ007_01885 [Paludibacteraceae bacterium]|nr:hypothetical protein [Paludibacteraceae bacterium]
MDVFDLFAKINLDTSEYENGLSKAKDGMSKIGGALAKGAGTVAKVTAKTVGAVAKVTAGAITTGASAVGAITKQAVESYANYEQLVGGMETLFDSNAKKVIDNASKAYKTAGISANEYMETVTSFSGSLLQSLDGDTAKATEKADKAIIAMSDNANKMGTSMESIQNAYRGFAKQNFTMLDNLSLGYGGTKSEMERLLKDAQAISGIKYNIESYADIIDAISVIQDKMGITGTTAKEAGTTISGSINSMKSAWSDLLTAFVDPKADLGKSIDKLMESVFGDGTDTNIGVIGNVLPAIEQAITGIGAGIEKALPKIMERLPKALGEILPKLIDSAKNILKSITTAIKDNSKDVAELVMVIIQAIIELTPDILDALISVAVSLVDALFSAIMPIAEPFLSEIIGNVGEFIESLKNKLSEGWDNIKNGVADFIESTKEFFDMLPEHIAYALAYALATIVKWCIDAYLTMSEKIPEIIENVKTWFSELPDKLREVFTNAIEALIEWFNNMRESVATAIPEIIENIKTFFANLPDELKEIGKNAISGFVNGIKEKWQARKEEVKGVFNSFVGGAKDALGIHSPSKVFAQIGEYCTEGFEEGIKGIADTSDIANNITAGLGAIDTAVSSNVTKVGSEDTSTGVMVNVTLAGDADGLFKVIKQESNKYYRATGRSAFA